MTEYSDSANGRMPDNPMTPMGEAFASLHEMYLGLRASGFTETEACHIIGSFLADQGRA